uniref:ATP-dependent Clp protease proteolytic subunit n=1 Tax=Arthropodium cirratum TaxID=51436 RepID=A0A288W6Z2_9ASPA|nr:ClpP-like protease [Arthropodium cirratum]
MPVGIPKIPFKNPGEDAPIWVDVFSRLYKDRYLFVLKELDQELANLLIGLLTFYSLNEEDTRDFIMIISSPGGLVMPAFAIYDMMRSVKPHIQTYGVAGVASTASFLLVGGRKGKRAALPHARITLHQPSFAMSADKTKQCYMWEIQQNLELMADLRDTMEGIYAEKTGHSIEDINLVMERDQFFSGIEAKEYGLVDHVPPDLQDENEKKKENPFLRKEDRYRQNNF